MTGFEPRISGCRKQALYQLRHDCPKQKYYLVGLRMSMYEDF